MSIDKMKKAIHDHSLLRVHGFPFLMPIIKALKSAGDEEVIIQQLSTMINNHINSKYEKITVTTGLAASKSEWRKAFLEVIENDFLKKGYIREVIALNYLKRNYPKVQWNDDTPYEIESMGVDIFSPQFKIGVSVKGEQFKGCVAEEKHEQQLRSNKFARTFIIYVDENTRACNMKEVK